MDRIIPVSTGALLITEHGLSLANAVQPGMIILGLDRNGHLAWQPMEPVGPVYKDSGIILWCSNGCPLLHPTNTVFGPDDALRVGAIADGFAPESKRIENIDLSDVPLACSRKESRIGYSKALGLLKTRLQPPGNVSFRLVHGSDSRDTKFKSIVDKAMPMDCTLTGIWTDGRWDWVTCHSDALFGEFTSVLWNEAYSFSETMCLAHERDDGTLAFMRTERQHVAIISTVKAIQTGRTVKLRYEPNYYPEWIQGHLSDTPSAYSDIISFNHVRGIEFLPLKVIGNGWSPFVDGVAVF